MDLGDLDFKSISIPCLVCMIVGFEILGSVWFVGMKSIECEEFGFGILLFVWFVGFGMDLDSRYL